MGTVIPGRGWSWAYTAASGATVYGLLGPFSERDLITRIRWEGASPGNGQVHLSLVYGGSSQANAAAITAGTSLIQRSNVDGALEQPEWIILLAANRPYELDLPCGFRGGPGSGYVIIRVENVITNNTWGLVSAYVVNVLPDPEVV